MSRSRTLLFLIVVVLISACRQQPGSETTVARSTATPTAVSTTAPTLPATFTPAPATVTPTPPAVFTATLAVDPAETAVFPLHAAIIITFNQPVDPDSITAPVRLSPFVSGMAKWENDYTQLSYTPIEGLAPGKKYTVSLAEGLTAVSGQSLAAPARWTLTTRAAPRVAHHTTTYTPFQDRFAPFEIEFDQEMDRESVAAALSITPFVPLNLSWQGNKLTVTPVTPLQPDTEYRLGLSRTAANSNGTPLPHAKFWTLRMAPLIATYTYPEAADRGAPVRVHFNYKMDPDSVREAIVLEDAAGQSIVGDVTWNEALTVCTFTPASRLPIGSHFAVAFSGPFTDFNGHELAQPPALPFTTPPPILQAGFDHDVAPDAAIPIRFDRPMNRETIAAALSITPTVALELEWDEESTFLHLTPASGAFAENRDYVVTIDATATGAEGELLLEEPYVFSFRTDRFNDVANFGYGPNAQVVDVDGRRAVQFAAMNGNGIDLTFELYQLDLSLFLDRYSSDFRGNGWEESLVSLEGTTLATTWTMTTTESAARYNSVQETLIPGEVPPGLYILNIRRNHNNDQLILVLTENAIAVKQAEGQLVAWVSDINGAPRPGIEVAIYARDGELLRSGTADANGVFRTEVGQDPQPLIVVARSGSDVTVSGLSNEWRTRNTWYGWWRTPPAAPDFAAYLYTDRPIYRPGQTVYFKAIVRRDDDALLSILPHGSPVTARLRDARNNVVTTLELEANHYGTVHGAFDVAEGAMLGNYAVEIEIDGEVHRQPFQVQDYRKPDYEVTVTTDKDAYVAGEEISVDLSSSYFFGEPLVEADADVNVYRLVRRYYYGWEAQNRSSDEYVWYETYGQHQQKETDGNGRADFTLEANDEYNGRTVHWRSSVTESILGVEVTVDDGSHQTASGFKVVRVYSAAEIATLDTGGYFHTPGSTFPIVANVKTIAGEPVNGRSLTLTLRRWSRPSRQYVSVQQTERLVTDDSGKATLPFTIDEAGFYQMHLEMRDRLGNVVTYETYVYAYSSGWSSWYGNDDALRVSADRESYAPGDTAQLLIESDFSGPALLTFERGTTRREQLVELNAPVTLVEVPIQPDDRPNIYVTVNAWEAQNTEIQEDTDRSLPDSRLHMAQVNLSVPVTDRTLLVTIIPDKETYAPREEATFTVRVTNQAGTPVAAEVSLAMVDEAIFSLAADQSGPIFDAFYYERDNIVRTYDTMTPRRYLGGGYGGGGGGGDLAGNPRSDFPDTAAWFPVLHTDYKGEASVSLTMPDNLTSWRFTAKATTTDTQVGETTANVTVRQDIVVRPILPRTLTAGDTFQLSALVHNYSDAPQTIAVGLTIHNSQFTIHNSQFQTVTIAAGDVEIVGWTTTAVSAGATTLTVQANAGNVTADAVALPLEVYPLAVPDVTTQVGQFRSELTTTLELPAGALPLSSVRIELARSIAGSLLEGLEYLTGFPYGCVEQTMSRALPNAVVGRAFYQLGVSSPTIQADLPAKVNASLQRLYGYQHNDGGWGWWYDDASHDYQTAWVLFGLATIRDAGYEVDQGVIDRGVMWLNENLDEMDSRTRAYALYSMAVAGQPNAEAALALAGEVDTLDTFSRAGLALALHELGEADAAAAVMAVLEETAVVTDTGLVYWPGDSSDGYYHRKTMASTTRNTALALSAFAQIQPGHGLEGGIVRYLMGQRRQNGWGTTNETSFAILGLTDHLLATSFNEAAANTDYAVILNGTTIAGGSLGRGEPAVTLEISAAQMHTGTNELRITQGGSGQLYYAINNRVYLAQTEIPAAGEVTVTRAYLTLNNQPLQEVAAGQLVKVKVTVKMPQDASYVIVEDSLPGGLEALNESLNNTSHVVNVNDWQEPRYYWQDYGYNYKEIRGDRVSFFITEFDAGTRTFTYIARATHAGAFHALPAEVYAMYDLAIWGRSASGALLVAE